MCNWSLIHGRRKQNTASCDTQPASSRPLPHRPDGTRDRIYSLVTTSRLWPERRGPSRSQGDCIGHIGAEHGAMASELL